MSEFSSIRQKAGVSLQKASDFLGAPVALLMDYENGTLRPSAREIQALKGLSLVAAPEKAQQPERTGPEQPAARDGRRAKEKPRFEGCVEERVIEANKHTFYEFFAGGGMARAGLGSRWTCVFANDFDPKKGASYRENWGDESLTICDVAALTPEHLQASADLAWASFPCQDLSLAGTGAGLSGERSGTFWHFWRLMRALAAMGRAPTTIVLENVCGALTSHDGEDFSAIGDALTRGNYRFGALVVDAVHFVPQSRPRLFIIAVRKNVEPDPKLVGAESNARWHTGALVEAYSKLSKRARANWIWWWLPAPPRRNVAFADLIDDEPRGVVWHTREETERLVGMMSTINLAKVKQAQKFGRKMVGGIYRRTRKDENGNKVQRAEVRFDEVSGCLRTPVGGSSRQTILIVEGDTVRSRLLSPREAARLMGLPDDFVLPVNYNEAYHLAGDGVVVAVVRFLAEHLLEPLLAPTRTDANRAA